MDAVVVYEKKFFQIFKKYKNNWCAIDSPMVDQMGLGDFQIS